MRLRFGSSSAFRFFGGVGFFRLCRWRHGISRCSHRLFLIAVCICHSVLTVVWLRPKSRGRWCLFRWIHWGMRGGVAVTNTSNTCRVAACRPWSETGSQRDARFCCELCKEVSVNRTNDLDLWCWLNLLFRSTFRLLYSLHQDEITWQQVWLR